MRIAQPKLEYWHIAGVCAGALFIVLLACERLDSPILNVIDARASYALMPLRSFRLVEFFLAITALGSAAGIAAVAFGAAVFLRARMRVIRRLAFVLAASAISMDLAKNFVERQRPSPLEWITQLNSYSFPSGHTTLATALYGFLLIVFYRRSQTRLQAALAIIIPSLIIFGVGLSRMVLDFHYLTDVIGGFLLGLFWLSVTFSLPHRP